MDRLGLLGVTAEQIRQKQRDARLKGQQSLFSQARTPEQLSGMAIASLIGSLGRGLFGKASQAEQDAQLREDIYGETDFTDVNSILGSADVLRSTDPRAAAQYELFAQNRVAEQQAAALAEEERQRELARYDLDFRGEQLTQQKRAEEIRKLQEERNRPQTPEASKLFNEDYYRNFFMSNRGAIEDVAALIDPDGIGKGKTKLSDEQAAALLNVMSTRATGIYMTNPELSDTEILGRVVQSITGVGDYQPNPGELDSQLKPDEPAPSNETTEITPAAETTGAKRKVRMNQIKETNKLINRLENKLKFYTARNPDDPRAAEIAKQLQSRKKFLATLTGG